MRRKLGKEKYININIKRSYYVVTHDKVSKCHYMYIYIEQIYSWYNKIWLF